MQKKPALYIFPIEKLLQIFKKELPQLKSPAIFLLQIAESFVLNEKVREFKDAVLLVRYEPSPVICLLGYFSSEEQMKINGLNWQLNNILPLLKFTGYQKAEKDCELLAQKLLKYLGRKKIEKCQFVAIPRGGLFVLGMLSYFLGLKKEQLQSQYSEASTVVLVDDSIYSGKRLGEYHKKYPGKELIVATLFSHPEVRHKITSNIDLIIGCISAHDLSDHAPQILGADYQKWHKDWLARVKNDIDWIGQPDYVCFPWSEPDVEIWNQELKKVEAGWKLIPGDFCIKNRPLSSKKYMDIQIQPKGRGKIKPSGDVVFARLKDQFIIGDLVRKESYALEDTSADIWNFVVKFGSVNKVIEKLTEIYNAPRATLETEVPQFIEELVRRNWLVRES